MPILPERFPKFWASTPEVKLNIAPNVSAVASTIANDVFMSALLQCSNHLEHEENLQRHGGSRSGICHATFVPITTFANLSNSCTLAEDNGQTFHSDSFDNTHDNRVDVGVAYWRQRQLKGLV